MLDRDVLNLLHAGVLRDDREAIEAVAVPGFCESCVGNGAMWTRG